MEKEYTIKSSNGLHARPISLILNKIIDFSDEIKIENVKTNKEGDFKSLLSVLSLGIVKDDKIIIKVKGSNDKKIFAILENTFEEYNII